jgi:hypothetical protein
VLNSRNRDVVDDLPEFVIGGPVVQQGQFVAEYDLRDDQGVGRHGMRPDLAAAGRRAPG